MVIFRHLTRGLSERRRRRRLDSILAWPTAICFGSAPVDRSELGHEEARRIYVMNSATPRRRPSTVFSSPTAASAATAV